MIAMETRAEYTLDQKTISLRVKSGLHERIKRIAKQKRRSMNQTIIIAIEKYLIANEISRSDVKAEFFRE
jgi:predicted HicB family RNase H-like nuclease